MNIHRFYAVFQRLFRGKRNELFLGLFAPSSDDTILDVGGYPEYWNGLSCESRVTCLNIDAPDEIAGSSQLTYVQGDARDLPYEDDAFDIVFSNSAIEHVGLYDDQTRFASEVRRVGKSYWIQTPNRWFFVEPHLLTPFVHYLPRAVQERMIRYFSVWGLVTKPTREDVRRFLDETHLLTRREMKSLFPDATVYEERFVFATKSFVAYKADGRRPATIVSVSK